MYPKRKNIGSPNRFNLLKEYAFFKIGPSLDKKVKKQIILGVICTTHQSAPWAHARYLASVLANQKSPRMKHAYVSQSNSLTCAQLRAWVGRTYAWPNRTPARISIKFHTYDVVLRYSIIKFDRRMNLALRRKMPKPQRLYKSLKISIYVNSKYKWRKRPPKLIPVFFSLFFSVLRSIRCVKICTYVFKKVLLT